MLTGDSAVEALAHRNLVPPPRPPQFIEGATASLRDAMARFADTDNHGPRRAALVETLAAIDLAEANKIAADVMAAHLDGSSVDIVAASWVVPTYALAAVLGLDDKTSGGLEQIRADAETLARVIGRNEPSSSKSDDAAQRMLALFADHDDPVVPVSLLYQNHDAVSGFMRATVHTVYAAAAPTSFGRTTRVATATVTIGDITLDQGEQVIIDLTGMRFGAGPHRCPGEELANALVAGVLKALDDYNYRVAEDGVHLGPDGFPTRFTMEAQQ